MYNLPLRSKANKKGDNIGRQHERKVEGLRNT